MTPRALSRTPSIRRAGAPKDRARDQYRHPIETLTFFGIKPDMTVVEIWPGGGWYTDILAPYLHDRWQALRRDLVGRERG